VDVLQTLLARRSIRRFTAEDVSADDERALVQAAFAAPSGNNARPWHFVFVRDPATRRRLQDMHRWTRMLGKAPLVVAVLAKDESPWWIEDGSAAIENMLTEAAALGLGSIWCGMRDEATKQEGGDGQCEARCRAVLGAPDDYRVLALVGFGYPADDKKPRTQVQPTRLSFERFGRHSREP
jgi:nitroreductase